MAQSCSVTDVDMVKLWRISVVYLVWIWCGYGVDMVKLWRGPVLYIVCIWCAAGVYLE